MRGLDPAIHLNNSLPGPVSRKGSSMQTASNPFDSGAMLEGIRRWGEIETPTEAPQQVNRLVSMVADGYRDLPAVLERVAGANGYGDHLIARSAGGAGAPGIVVLSHLDTVHAVGFIERLPFRIE